jgi:putative adhesin/cell wall-active antibiotic response 4TMS protein YvqF
MSNPVQTPPPLVPLRPRRRSFAGPVVLIVLGIIFLMGNLHMLSWGRLGTLFAHYWPALLILWGIIKLIEYQQAQRDGLPHRGIGAGGVFLVIFIVVCGLSATQFVSHWGELRENLNIDDGDLDNIFGETYNFDDHIEQDLPAGATSLRISDDHGAVRVSASTDNKITVVVRKRVNAESQGDADKYNSETKPTITATGGMLTLEARTQAAGDHAVQSDLDISIPRKMEVHVVSRRGDVSVTARDGVVDINNQHGDVSVEDVTGAVKLTLEHSSAKVEQITGDVHISGRLNDVSVTDIKGEAQFEGEFQESVKLARITKSVTFKSSRTDLEFSRIDGDLDLDSDDLHADQLTGPVHLTTRSKQIRLDEVSGDVRVQDENGGIEVSMRSLGNVQIDSRNGDIHLSVPEKAGFHLDARTRDGEIQSDFPELKVDNNEHEAKATGSVGNGTSHIVLNNEHDGIEIRRAAKNGGPSDGITGGIPSPAKPAKPAKALPPPKTKVEPTEN